MRMEARTLLHPVVYVSLAGILFLPYFYYVFISEFNGECVMGQKKARSHCF